MFLPAAGWNETDGRIASGKGPSMSKTILLTNSGGSFGLATMLALGTAGHTVYGGQYRPTDASHAGVFDAARRENIDLRVTALDVFSQPSVDAAVEQLIRETGRLDVVVHNSGYLMSGPADAFTAEQLSRLYETNVLSTQNVNRAVIPQFRRQRHGLIVWVSSISSAGSIPPYLAPYFSKANMDSVAGVYARELASAGIGYCTVLPRWVHGDRHGAVIDSGSVADVISTLIDLPVGEHPLRIFVHCRGTAKRRESNLRGPADTVVPLTVRRGPHSLKPFPSRRAI
jgi:NAD(P)-dependent dehydrogenase (short-subunit alcohol dehydrogenase family)